MKQKKNDQAGKQTITTLIYDSVIFSTGMLAKSWEVVSFDLEALSPDLAKLLKLSWWKAGEQIAPLPSHFGPRSPRLRIAGISRRRYIHLQPGATNQR